jgi:hypothetical protein
MAKQIVNRGSTANDGSGDNLRDGADKINSNFNEIYSILGDGTNLLNADVDFGTNKVYFSNVVQTVTELAGINATTYTGLIMHVASTGSLYYAQNGIWRKLLTDNEAGNVVNYTDPLDPVAYSGNYGDLRNRPTLPTEITDLGITDGSAGQVLSTDGTGNFTFRDITATNVAFADILNKPTTLAGYGINDAFTGRYDDLIDAPTLFDGAYASLTGKPTIATDLSGLTDSQNLLFDKDYNSLNNRPSIPADLGDLTDSGNLLFSRSYNDLSNIPTSFASLTSLAMSLGVTVDEFSNDADMTDNSASALVTERAVKTFVTSQISAIDLPTQLTDLGITDGTAGQVLTTNGAGAFTFQAPGDQIGNFTLAASVIDTDDSSAITITPSVVISSSLTVDDDLTVQGNINSTATGTPEIYSLTNVSVTTNNGVSTWDFGSDGTLTFPDASVQSTAYTGTIPGYISIASLKAEVAASTDFADFQSRIAAL